ESGSQLISEVGHNMLHHVVNSQGFGTETGYQFMQVLARNSEVEGKRMVKKGEISCPLPLYGNRRVHHEILIAEMHDFRRFFIVGGFLGEEIMLGGFYAEPVQYDWVYALDLKDGFKAQVHQRFICVVAHIFFYFGR